MARCSPSTTVWCPRTTPIRLRKKSEAEAMKFTDLFVERPVLSAVVSLLILVLGLRSIFQLPITQYPATENATIIVSTAYYGADAATVAGFITQPLEQA